MQPGRKFSFWSFSAVCAALYCAVFTTIEFSEFPVQGIKGTAMLAVQWGAAALAASGLIGLIMLNRWVAAVGLPLLLAASTALAYFRLTMAASLTPAVVELWQVTGAATSMDLVSLRLVLLLVAAIAVAAAAVWFRWRRVGPVCRPAAWLLLFAALLCVSKIPRCENAIYARSPFSVYSSVSGYLKMRKIAAEHRNTYSATPATALADSVEVVVVIGESLRADHLGLNGYERNTTPLLSREPNLLSLPQVWTDPYFTFTSVPFMLTAADRSNPDAAYTEQSFITLFRNAGFRTVWVSNQEESDTYTYFMYEADSLIRNNPSINLYNFTPHFDSELLPHLERVFASPEPRKLTVVHTIGSHWWYGCHFSESDPGLFLPVAHSKVISDNTRQEMVNSYDNTILATDRFLTALIGMLREKNAVVIFQSDHGESLGENGRFLHGEDAPELHRPAAMVWMSDSYIRLNPEKAAALRQNAPLPLTTEYLFHSALDAAAIHTAPLDSTLSILTPPADTHAGTSAVD